jgi:CheY-like chemotaxis protein
MTQRDVCRVLVVDDNHDNAESLAMLVQVMGHEAATAHDGMAAIEAVDRFRPDLILLDIGLPKLDGFEVAEQLRARPDGDALFLVAITGWARDEEKQRAKSVGFDEHMTKPVDPNRLETLIRSICARR